MEAFDENYKNVFYFYNQIASLAGEKYWRECGI